MFGGASIHPCAFLGQEGGALSLSPPTRPHPIIQLINSTQRAEQEVSSLRSGRWMIFRSSSSSHRTVGSERKHRRKGRRKGRLFQKTMAGLVSTERTLFLFPPVHRALCLLSQKTENREKEKSPLLLPPLFSILDSRGRKPAGASGIYCLLLPSCIQK